MMTELPTTILGRTGLEVTRLGIGGAYCETPGLYRAALDLGVTYLDTARNYRNGDDERVIGEAIVGRRHEIILATKTIARDAAGARKDLETSLRLLGTDTIDIWQLHHVNTAEDRKQVLGPGGAYEAAIRARDQGLVRFIGVTGHDWGEVGEDVATDLFDTVLCWYNPAMREPEELVFPHAQAHGVGVVIMRTTATDKLLEPADAPPPEVFYRYGLAHPAVDVALMGLRDLERQRRVGQALRERLALSAEERREIEVFGARNRELAEV